MTTRRRLLVSPIGWILLLVTALIALGITSGVPVEFELDSPRIKHRPEHSYVTQLPELTWPLIVVADRLDVPKASVTELFEDDRPLGPAHTRHDSIRDLGLGRYSHWQRKLVFSTSDNTDPRANGRRYAVVMRVQLARTVAPVWLLVLALAATAVCIRWLRRGLFDLPDLLLPVGLWTCVALSLAATLRAGGIVLWLLIGAGVIFLIWAVMMTRRTAARVTGRPWRASRAAQNATLLAASLTITLVAVEVLLMVWERRATESGAATVTSEGRAAKRPGNRRSKPSRKPMPLELAIATFGVDVPAEVLRSAQRRAELITLPPELEQRPAEVEGANRAYTWHGALHVKDPNSFRRATPFPAREEHVFRVVVVGDSLTYGQGIEERWTYARQLEALLAPDYNVEVLNLGVSGHQSEDILGKVRDFLPSLNPDLVIYGVCPNDFLPSGIGQYQNNYAYALPLPESVKTFFTDNSRLAQLSEDAYNLALLKLGLRVGFFDDILNGFTGYQQRFARDVARMNELVTAHGLPPMVALTLDQHPHKDSPGYRISQAAEQYLEEAGMDVIDMAPYYQQFGGLRFRVSRWEGHPNETANAIWATMLNRHLRSLDALRPFRKTGG